MARGRAEEHDVRDPPRAQVVVIGAHRHGRRRDRGDPVQTVVRVVHLRRIGPLDRGAVAVRVEREVDVQVPVVAPLAREAAGGVVDVLGFGNGGRAVRVLDREPAPGEVVGELRGFATCPRIFCPQKLFPNLLRPSLFDWLIEPPSLELGVNLGVHRFVRGHEVFFRNEPSKRNRGFSSLAARNGLIEID